MNVYEKVYLGDITNGLEEQSQRELGIQGQRTSRTLAILRGSVIRHSHCNCEVISFLLLCYLRLEECCGTSHL
jgi:hypothetical protein